jgi:hypothetical protein
MTTHLTDTRPTDSAFRWSASDLAAANATLARASNPPAPVVILTDEELVALDGLQHSQLVPTPWLDAQAFDRTDLGGIALRGLIARKLVLPVFTDAADGTIKLTSVEEIVGPLMLRRTARTVVRVERLSNTGRRWLFGYVHDGVKVLVEDLDDNGLHEFSVTDTEGWVEFVDAVVNPRRLTGSDGVPDTMAEASFTALTELPAPLAGAETISMVSASTFGAVNAENLAVYAGPERLACLTPNPDGETVDYSEVSAESLRRRLSALASWAE